MSRVSITDIDRARDRLKTQDATDFIDHWASANVGHCTMIATMLRALALALRELAAKNPKRMTVVEFRQIQASMLAYMGPQYDDKFTVTRDGDKIKVFLRGLVGVDKQPSVQTDWSHRDGGTTGAPCTISYRDNTELSVYPIWTKDTPPTSFMNEALLMYAAEAERYITHWTERRDRFWTARRVTHQAHLILLYEQLAATMRAIHDNPLSHVGDHRFDEIFNPISIGL